MDENLDSIDQLATEWWQNHGPAGIFSGSGSYDDRDDVKSDRAFAVEDELEKRTLDRETMGVAVIALARAAPSLDVLPYIGTWFLEPAYDILHEEIFDLLDHTDLPLTWKSLIRSGIAI